MKKISVGMRALTLATALSFFSVSLFTEDIVKTSVPYRDAVYPEYISYTPYITAKGQITKAKELSVIHNQSAYISEVCVAVGDIIEKGDTICTVSLSRSNDKSDYYNSVIKLPEKKIIADYNGVVTDLDIAPDSVFSGGTVAQINGTGTYLVSAVVSERNISSVNLGDKALVTGSALSKKSYDAEIIEISDTARKLSDESFETVIDVSLLISDTSQKIYGGVSATAKIYTDDKRDILTVPYECIFQDDDGNEFVYVCKDNRAVKKEIITGVECDDGVEITDGIKETDLIVISPDGIVNNDFVRYEVIN